MRRLKRIIRKAIWHFGYEISIKKVTDSHLFTCISLRPVGRARGRVLLAYILEPFISKNIDALNTHTHFWESEQIAQTYLSLGYEVDVINYLNYAFEPKRRYDLFISARSNFARLAARLNEDCFKVVHLDTSHWMFNNHAAYARYYALQHRQKATLKLRKIFNETSAIEHADCATLIGNDKTQETYQYAGKTIFKVPVPTCMTYSFPEKKNFEKVRNSYLWMGSDGLVNKGLDLVLEVFAGLPDHNLHVCGPIDQEEDFTTVYKKHLYRSTNIKTHGWIDVTSKKFNEITDGCIALVYPSCSEGQAGVVATCMQAGLLPIISKESGFPSFDFGRYLSNCTKDEIKNAVLELSDTPVDRLIKRARDTWMYANEVHSRDNYKRVYREVARTIVDELMPDKAKREENVNPESQL